MIPEAAAEIQNQFAFISALLGGFSITLVVGLLQLPSQRHMVEWAIGAAVVAAVSLLMAAVAGVWGAIWLAERPQLGPLPETPLPLLTAFQWSGRAFLTGVSALLVSLGLSGWTYSRRLGIFSSAAAAITWVSLLYFLIARMGFN